MFKIITNMLSRSTRAGMSNMWPTEVTVVTNFRKFETWIMAMFDSTYACEQFESFHENNKSKAENMAD